MLSEMSCIVHSSAASVKIISLSQMRGRTSDRKSRRTSVL